MPEKTKNFISEFYVYILECADGSLYTGYTNDLQKRIQTHNAGKGAKYTRSRLPVKLVYSEIYKDKTSALRREYAIKQFTRAQKLFLIQNASRE
ncbi:MAG: GIY-YIG nuclease family protein [Oscillospiraceae bacterium]|nr:GIY-YIG nuclease family protein [Oscillospiraceae bacterium]